VLSLGKSRHPSGSKTYNLMASMYTHRVTSLELDFVHINVLGFFD
jgi:hypothetical protein